MTINITTVNILSKTLFWIYMNSFPGCICTVELLGKTQRLEKPIEQYFQFLQFLNYLFFQKIFPLNILFYKWIVLGENKEISWLMDILHAEWSIKEESHEVCRTTWRTGVLSWKDTQLSSSFWSRLTDSCWTSDMRG